MKRSLHFQTPREQSRQLEIVRTKERDDAVAINPAQPEISAQPLATD
jgi:hypothetical protein